ncbi:MAG: hypothetical protein RRY34_05135, partial [Victivallaceae bacterium]
MGRVIPQIDFDRVEKLIDLALEEDLGDRGDTTTNAVIPAATRAVAQLLCKEDCVAAGLPVAEKVFKRIDPECEFIALVKDGDFCPKGTIMAEIRGS